MTDNKKLKGKQDRAFVSSTDNSEVEYLHKQFPKLSHRQVISAIKKAGPGRKKIRRYINQVFGY